MRVDLGSCSREVTAAGLDVLEVVGEDQSHLSKVRYGGPLTSQQTVVISFDRKFPPGVASAISIVLSSFLLQQTSVKKNPQNN